MTSNIPSTNPSENNQGVSVEVSHEILRSEVSNLLARIHGDQGRLERDQGVLKALEAADRRVTGWVDRDVEDRNVVHFDRFELSVALQSVKELREALLPAFAMRGIAIKVGVDDQEAIRQALERSGVAVELLEQVLGVGAPENVGSISREAWQAIAAAVYVEDGDTPELAQECARFLWRELDVSSGEIPDPAATAREDLRERPWPKRPSSGNTTIDALRQASRRRYHERAQSDQSVTPPFLHWLDHHSRDEGVAANEAWNAGVSWALRSQRPVAWRNPSNVDPGQSVTFDKAVQAQWPHRYPQALFAIEPVSSPDEAQGQQRDHDKALD